MWYRAKTTMKKNDNQFHLSLLAIFTCNIFCSFPHRLFVFSYHLREVRRFIGGTLWWDCNWRPRYPCIPYMYKINTITTLLEGLTVDHCASLMPSTYMRRAYFFRLWFDFVWHLVIKLDFLCDNTDFILTRKT